MRSCQQERQLKFARLDCRRAKDLMTSNITVLHKIADVLLEREQINGDEFQKILADAQVSQYLKKDAPEVTVPYQKPSVVAS